MRRATTQPRSRARRGGAVLVSRLTRAVLVPPLICLGSVGCESSDAKQCRAQYLATHALMQSVDVDDFESVEKGLVTVKATTEACTAAALHEELDQLRKVQSKLQASADYLHTHGKPRKLTEEERAKLLKEGDPSCPKGQAYKPKGSEEQIRCTGPKLSDLNWSQAEAYYDSRGFKLTKTGNELKAEYGSESYTYVFEKADDTQPASCIKAFVAPGIPWEESVSRLTGALPRTLAEGKPVKTSRGPLPLTLTPDQTQAIYQLGNCN